MIKVTNKYIADYLGKQINTINTWKQRTPKLLNLCRLGAFCVRNGLDLYKLEKLTVLKNAIKLQDNSFMVKDIEFFENFTYDDNGKFAYENLTGNKYVVKNIDDLPDMLELSECEY